MSNLIKLADLYSLTSSRSLLHGHLFQMRLFTVAFTRICRTEQFSCFIYNLVIVNNSLYNIKLYLLDMFLDQSIH